MLVEPKIWELYTAFDLMLVHLYPNLFTDQLMTSPDFMHTLEDSHRILQSILPWSLECDHSFSIHQGESVGERYKIHEISPDMLEVDIITIPCLQDDMDAVQPELVGLQTHLGFSDLQFRRFLDFHIAVSSLLLEFALHEKDGRDFFHTFYALELLRQFLPPLTHQQAQRFFYWGILKFRCSEDLHHWLTMEDFRTYLNKFKN